MKYNAKDVQIYVNGKIMPIEEFISNYDFELEPDSDTQEVYNTGLEAKIKYWPIFSQFIENQFKFGGKKYQLARNKETTDWVCELSPGKTGADWVIQTICKYAGRFINFKLERDLFKIATYAFIMWLKMGFHLRQEHDEDLKDHE